jgi:hypothetical protein
MRGARASEQSKLPAPDAERIYLLSEAVGALTFAGVAELIPLTNAPSQSRPHAFERRQ